GPHSRPLRWHNRPRQRVLRPRVPPPVLRQALQPVPRPVLPPALQPVLPQALHSSHCPCRPALLEAPHCRHRRPAPGRTTTKRSTKQTGYAYAWVILLLIVVKPRNVKGRFAPGKQEEDKWRVEPALCLAIALP